MHSQANVEPAQATLEDQLREMYGRLAYTHKTHEKMADAYVARYRTIKMFEIGISALSSGSLIVAAFADSPAGSLLGALLSTILLGILLYFKEGALGEAAQRHSDTAGKLWGLRERLLSLLVDFREGQSSGEVRSARDAINIELERVYLGAPRTNSKAYANAQKALKKSEELYFSDTELDRMLPESLRR